MAQTTEHTSTFELCDGDTRHIVHEHTIFNHSHAGGIPRKTPADRKYKTPSGQPVGHRNHKEFQIPGCDAWLPRCDDLLAADSESSTDSSGS